MMARGISNMKLGKKGFAQKIMGATVGLVFLVVSSVIVQNIITNQTASGNITGLAAMIAPYVVPFLWLAGLAIAASVAYTRMRR